MNTDKKFMQLVGEALKFGHRVSTRNSAVLRIHPASHALHQSFFYTPLVNVRRTAWRQAVQEMEWFLSGSNLVSDLPPPVRKWWAPWADEGGRVPYNYSVQFRETGGLVRDPENGPLPASTDQLIDFVTGIRQHPYSRRNLMTTWNPVEMVLKGCPITNCHGTVVQAFVCPNSVQGEKPRLLLKTYQRSADLLLGLPHNWLQYWAFLLWLANATDTYPDCLVWVGGDVHLYEAHEPVARKMYESWYARAEDAPAAPNLTHTQTPDDFYPGTDVPRFLAADFGLDGEYAPLSNDKLEMVV